MALNVSDLLGRDGYNVLCIDLAPQYGGLTDSAGFSNLLYDDHYDITDVLLTPERSLRDILLRGDEHGMNFDLIPANMALDDFDQMVARSNISGNDWTFLRWEMNDADLWEDYDVVVIDAEAGRDLPVRNAILATRNVILPTENSRRGRRSIPGVQDFLEQLESGMKRSGADIDIDLLAVVPNETADDNADEVSREKYEEMDAPVTPFEIRRRKAMLRDAMEKQKTVMEYFDEKQYRPRANEEYTLEKFRLIGNIILEGSLDAVYPEVEEMAEDPDVKGVHIA